MNVTRQMIGGIRMSAKRAWPLWGLLLVAACNDHPLQTLDSVVTAANRQEITLPAKTKLDFLFVIDNSGSMCEEQRNLSRNFSEFSRFLFSELGNAADYRIAVTSTDLRTDGQKGRFLNTPAEPRPALNCVDPDTGEPDVPETADCPADLPLIIKSGKDGNIADQADLELKFRCQATLGTGGDGFEKGLEAMRLALSCDGPNAALFASCCTEDHTYDPICEIPEGAPEPEFLRPDAVLVVVFVSDENDCSDPASHPSMSKRAICKYGPVDGDQDGIPDGYRDRNLCAGDPAQCYRTECGNPPLAPEDCHTRRCAISRGENSHCEWNRDELVPVEDYFDFLVRLKSRPTEQIVVATIVGDRLYTESGCEITYNPPARPTDPTCDVDSDLFDPDKPLGECCPQGRCEGLIQPSCESLNGVAFNGRRYLELAARFENNGISTSICVDNFAEPLRQIKQRVAEILGTYCLDKPPACQVPPARDANGKVQPARSCETDAERADPVNYPVRVRMQCVHPIEEGGTCTEFLPAAYLGRDQWALDLDEASCAGGALVRLNNPPPAGAEVFVEFLVDVGHRASAGEDGVVDGGVAGDATLSAADQDAALDHCR